MTVQPVRKLIIENKIHEAFQLLEPLVKGELINELHLLWTQFVYWESQQLLNKASMVERNRILYALLETVSELEGDKVLKEMEVNLKDGYRELTTLLKTGTTDRIMLFLFKTQPLRFKERIVLEKNNAASPLTETFDKSILNAYILENDLDTSPQVLFEFIQDKYNSIPKFFTEWLKYYSDKEGLIDGIQFKIRYQEKKYSNKLLLMGFLAGISSAAIIGFFGDEIDFDTDDDDDDD